MSTGPQSEGSDSVDYFEKILQDAAQLHREGRLHGVAIIFADENRDAFTATYGDLDLIAAMGHAISQRKREADERLAKLEGPTKTRN